VAADLVELGEQRPPAGLGAGDACDEVDAVDEAFEVEAWQEGEQGLAGGAAVGGMREPACRASSRWW
jgi:hypothetical protein